MTDKRRHLDFSSPRSSRSLCLSAYKLRLTVSLAGPCSYYDIFSSQPTNSAGILRMWDRVPKRPINEEALQDLTGQVTVSRYLEMLTSVRVKGNRRIVVLLLTLLLQASSLTGFPCRPNKIRNCLTSNIGVISVSKTHT